MRLTKKHDFFSEMVGSTKNPIVDLRHDGKYTITKNGDFVIQNCKLEELEIAVGLNALRISGCVIRKITFTTGTAAEIYIDESVIGSFQLNTSAMTSHAEISSSFLGNYIHCSEKTPLTTKFTRFKILHVKNWLSTCNN